MIKSFFLEGTIENLGNIYRVKSGSGIIYQYRKLCLFKFVSLLCAMQDILLDKYESYSITDTVF